MKNFSYVKFIVWDPLLTLEKDNAPSLPSPWWKQKFPRPALSQHILWNNKWKSRVLSTAFVTAERATDVWENKSEQ